jgi:hypothetical protein
MAQKAHRQEFELAMVLHHSVKLVLWGWFQYLFFTSLSISIVVNPSSIYSIALSQLWPFWHTSVSVICDNQCQLRLTCQVSFFFILNKYRTPFDVPWDCAGCGLFFREQGMFSLLNMYYLSIYVADSGGAGAARLHPPGFKVQRKQRLPGRRPIVDPTDKHAKPRWLRVITSSSAFKMIQKLQHWQSLPVHISCLNFALVYSQIGQ